MDFWNHDGIDYVAPWWYETVLWSNAGIVVGYVSFGRENYTKSDWLLWSAVLSDDLERQKQIISKVNYFLTHTKQRVPFSDWFDTVNGNYYHFKNRTVQGGIFILPRIKMIKK